MKALTIKDLSLSLDLDTGAMRAVHGGTGRALPYFVWPSHTSIVTSSVDFNAAQMLGQSQNTQVNNGNNAAFVHGITATVTPSQSGSNNIHFG